MFIAALTMLVMSICARISPILALVPLCGAGFLAVRIYQKQSAQQLSPNAGAKLGWMTGLWLFVITTVLVALMSVAIQSASVREQLVKSTANTPEVAKLLDDPHALVMQLLSGLAMWFFVLTLIPGLGGMLGAKMPIRKGPNT